MSELCNCIFFSLSLGGRKEKRIRTRLNETAQSRSASEAKVNKPRSLFYITAPWLLQQPCLCCLPPHFCFQPAARLSSAFTPPKASSPHLNSTSRHRRHKQLWRQTELWWVSFSELPVLTIPNGAGKSSCVTIPHPDLLGQSLLSCPHLHSQLGSTSFEYWRFALYFCLHLFIGFH